MEKDPEIKKFYKKYPFPNDEKIDNHQWILKSLPEPIKEGSSILDIGSGTGEMSCFLSKYGNVVGIDFSEESIAKAIELKEKFKIKNLKFDVDNIVLKKERETFDYLFCIGVLHHIPEINQAIENIKECMNKDSYAVISVYNKYGKFFGLQKHKKTKNKARYMDTFEHPYEIYYSKKQFVKILNQHNLKIVGIWRNIPEILRLITGRGELMTFCVKKD